MEKYISRSTISECIEFFRAREYKKPEQIGLYFYFKAKGINPFLPIEYNKWGRMEAQDRKDNLRLLYDLAGVFDVLHESGLKKTALFPFSIVNRQDYKGTSFYNGGTAFSGLISRISDTLDNALVSTIIQKNPTNDTEIKLKPDYLSYIATNYLNNHRVSLKHLSAWYYRFWKIEMPEDTSEQDFEDVCVLSFLLNFHISVAEYETIFANVNANVTSAPERITGTELRTMLRFSDGFSPEVNDDAYPNCMPFVMSITEEEVRELLTLRGEALTYDRIVEILTELDEQLAARFAEVTAAESRDPHAYTRDELMAMDNKEFIFTCLEIMSVRRLFNNYTLPILESREQCALLFRHNNMHGILHQVTPGANDEDARAAMLDEGGRPRYYAETFSIGENEYYVSSQWRPDREDARGAFLDWLFELLLAIKFDTGLVSDFERNRIVFGAPGTGKSHQLKKDTATLLENTTGSYERVTFHPEYTYSQFVGCYKPVTNARGEIRYDFVPGPFMRVLVAALKSGRTDEPQPHLLLIEEINRAKVAAVFGEVFQLLDRDEKGTSDYEIAVTEDVRTYLISELGKAPDTIKIPDNMFIWATMNSADQGVYPMDTAFKRRWNFEYIGIDDNDDKVGGIVTLGKDEYAVEINWNQFRKAINDVLAVDFGINEDKLLGPYFLDESVFAYDDEGKMIRPQKFIEAFKSKVIMYLYEDAAKPVRNRLFQGCDSSKYSSVCKAFEEKGYEIFGASFADRYAGLEE